MVDPWLGAQTSGGYRLPIPVVRSTVQLASAGFQDIRQDPDCAAGRDRRQQAAVGRVGAGQSTACRPTRRIPGVTNSDAASEIVVGYELSRSAAPLEDGPEMNRALPGLYVVISRRRNRGPRAAKAARSSQARAAALVLESVRKFKNLVIPGRGRYPDSLQGPAARGRARKR